MGVSLRNAWQKPFIATMYHDVFCRRRGECCCGVVKVRSEKGKLVTERQPKSFQIDVGKSDEFDQAVLHLPQVKKAVKDGWLVRGDLEAQAKAQPAKPAAPAEPAKPVEAPAPKLSNGNGNGGKKKGR